mmetsp:Transcript_28705/g.55863  ORF Transcript_28705/g.55863 Transcript_28705/m.55863 type:complete len:250 (+) Transcript_28705:690-1439(+)
MLRRFPQFFRILDRVLGLLNLLPGFGDNRVVALSNLRRSIFHLSIALPVCHPVSPSFKPFLPNSLHFLSGHQSSGSRGLLREILTFLFSNKRFFPLFLLASFVLCSAFCFLGFRHCFHFFLLLLLSFFFSQHCIHIRFPVERFRALANPPHPLQLFRFLFGRPSSEFVRVLLHILQLPCKSGTETGLSRSLCCISPSFGQLFGLHKRNIPDPFSHTVQAVRDERTLILHSEDLRCGQSLHMDFQELFEE